MALNPKYIPTEAEEQKTLFSWADMASFNYPELELMYHIPNGGSRNKLEAANLRKQGVKPGVPDICLPVPRGKYHGLYIELKRTQGGKLSENQKRWLKKLAAQGYKSLCCEGWEEAAREILAYLSLGGQQC